MTEDSELRKLIEHTTLALGQTAEALLAINRFINFQRWVTIGFGIWIFYHVWFMH